MLKPLTEYVITDVYNSLTGPVRRGDMRFRTDAQGNVWTLTRGKGQKEDACMLTWFTNHPRLVEIGPLSSMGI